MKTQQAARQPYQKPGLRRIRIVQGELAVTGCKTRTSSRGPTVGCFRSSCRAVGS